VFAGFREGSCLGGCGEFFWSGVSKLGYFFAWVLL